jgi:hypothetical protein
LYSKGPALGSGKAGRTKPAGESLASPRIRDTAGSDSHKGKRGWERRRVGDASGVSQCVRRCCRGLILGLSWLPVRWRNPVFEWDRIAVSSYLCRQGQGYQGQGKNPGTFIVFTPKRECAIVDLIVILFLLRALNSESYGWHMTEPAVTE